MVTLSGKKSCNSTNGLDRSESRVVAAPQSASSQTRIAHGERPDGPVAEDTRTALTEIPHS